MGCNLHDNALSCPESALSCRAMGPEVIVGGCFGPWSSRRYFRWLYLRL